ncbi:MAG TPA: hypothetical protein V6D19_12985 [Stenomitos sp.]
MDEIKKAVEVVVPATTEVKKEEAPLQDPVKKELDKVKGAKLNKLTPAERLIFEKKKIEKQLKELGHTETPEAEDDDKPVTHGELKNIEINRAIETAVEMAESIENDHERDLTKFHLENTIKPSGDPERDFKAAVALVNSVKNGQVTQEVLRRGTPSAHVSGAAAPGKTENVFEPTPEERVFMGPPYNMSKEQIIASRPKA